MLIGDIVFCEDPGLLGVFLIAKRAIVLIKILVPVILIILSMIQVAKAVVSSDEKIMEAVKGTTGKLLAGLIVFIIPTFIQFILDVVKHDGSKFLACYENATPEKIQYFQVLLDERQSQEYKDILSRYKDTKYEWIIEEKERAENTIHTPEGAEDGAPPFIGPIKDDGTSSTTLWDKNDVRKKTEASAADIDAAIAQIVPNDGTNGMIGLGSALKKAEQHYGVNAIFLGSIIALESGWGTSNFATACNNYGGVKGTPSCKGTAFKSYPSKEAFVMSLASLLKTKYIDSDGRLSVEQINQKYCPPSDGGCSTWASSIIGIADNSLGKKLPK